MRLFQLCKRLSVYASTSRLLDCDFGVLQVMAKSNKLLLLKRNLTTSVSGNQDRLLNALSLPLIFQLTFPVSKFTSLDSRLYASISLPSLSSTATRGADSSKSRNNSHRPPNLIFLVSKTVISPFFISNAATRGLYFFFFSKWRSFGSRKQGNLYNM